MRGKYKKDFYAYAAFYLAIDFQVLSQIEKYKDVNPDMSNNEWYLVRINYYFSEKNKLMADYRTQFNRNKNINEAKFQYQIF